jgi:hypothetical protein
MVCAIRSTPFVGLGHTSPTLVGMLRMWHSLGRVQDQVCTSIRITYLLTDFVLASGNLLLHSEEPLFKRYISMSGTSLMLQPLPPFLPEIVYSAVIKSLDAEGVSSQERIKKLLDLPNDKLAIFVPPGLPLLPVVDNDIIPGNLNFDQVSSKQTPSVSLPGRTWCEEVLVGDCQFDVSFSGHTSTLILNTLNRHPFSNSCLALG